VARKKGETKRTCWFRRGGEATTQGGQLLKNGATEHSGSTFYLRSEKGNVEVLSLKIRMRGTFTLHEIGGVGKIATKRKPSLCWKKKEEEVTGKAAPRARRML